MRVAECSTEPSLGGGAGAAPGEALQGVPFDTSKRARGAAAPEQEFSPRFFTAPMVGGCRQRMPLCASCVPAVCQLCGGVQTLLKKIRLLVRFPQEQGIIIRPRVPVLKQGVSDAF